MILDRLPPFVQRHVFNLFPCYRGTGGRIAELDSRWRRVVVRLPLNLRTRNYVGSIFGGSMFGAVDPIYMLMLIVNLGPDYVVWDKAAQIRFRRPAKKTLRAVFELSDGELDAIRCELAEKDAVERTYTVELTDPDGVVCARVEKLIHVARRAGGRS
jgi:acyl-coenzyme A thioesterase PaaI-like protein